MRKIYSFLFMVLAAMTMNAKTIYLDATQWGYADAAYAAHAWNATDDATDYQLALVTGETAIYSADIREDAVGIIFLRRAPQCSTPNLFDCYWNRTDQSIPEDKNMFRVTGWAQSADQSCPGEWVNYGDPVADVVIKVLKPEGWASMSIWAWASADATFMAQFTEWPGVAMQNLGNGWYQFTVKADAWFLVNNGEGTKQSQSAHADEAACFTITSEQNAEGHYAIVNADCPSDTQAIDQIGNRPSNNKMIKDGKLVIVRDGVEYNAIGTKL